MLLRQCFESSAFKWHEFLWWQGPGTAIWEGMVQVNPAHLDVILVMFLCGLTLCRAAALRLTKGNRSAVRTDLMYLGAVFTQGACVSQMVISGKTFVLFWRYWRPSRRLHRVIWWLLALDLQHSCWSQWGIKTNILYFVNKNQCKTNLSADW